MAITAREIHDLIAAVPPRPMPTTCRDCGEKLEGGRPICDDCDAKNAMDLLRRLAATDSRYADALATAEAKAKSKSK